MNIWATQQLTLSDHVFFYTSCCCCAWCGSDVFISLSKRKCLQLWRIPPEPVTLLVSMAVLQAAPQAGCVQGPIQPVFSAVAPLMYSPEAGVKLPSAETENTAPFLSVAGLPSFTRRCIAKSLIWISHYSQHLLSNCYMSNTVKVLWPRIWETLCSQ